MNLAFRIQPPRGGPFIDEGQICTPSILAGLACCNAFGGGASKSTTTSNDQRTAASEGSLAVGSGGSFSEQQGGVSGQGNKIGSTEVGAGSHITITDTSADVLKTALDKYAELSAGFGSSLNQFVSQASEDQSQKVATLLGAVDASKQSQDSATQNKNVFVVIIVAVLILVGFVAWRKS